MPSALAGTSGALIRSRAVVAATSAHAVHCVFVCLGWMTKSCRRHFGLSWIRPCPTRGGCGWQGRSQPRATAARWRQQGKGGRPSAMPGAAALPDRPTGRTELRSPPRSPSDTPQPLNPNAPNRLPLRCAACSPDQCARRLPSAPVPPPRRLRWARRPVATQRNVSRRVQRKRSATQRVTPVATQRSAVQRVATDRGSGAHSALQRRKACCDVYTVFRRA